ncbi:LuxR C-terminal-related transcriptional regulator [Gordonia aquimaris]|uniref:LuxR C-terminal-related transcriptional regulator n=1 Tax=Gordonia aquimaris TaxID=2984863 RepID=A0A9X3D0F2_9ACTN|nr:LuxR C-terminal-related transcriptional regulator [Gordonia aquimaris]MCX2962783.1 LuxR C-terminal-related transcriptional regulator [Gordonia aquimaris]
MSSPSGGPVGPAGGGVIDRYSPDLGTRMTALMSLSASLTEIADLTELGEAYFGQIGSVMDLPMSAVYLFGDAGPTPDWYASRNVSDRFMTTYERCGRQIDGELRSLLDSAGPVYNLAGQTLAQWRRSEVYRRVDCLENMVHVLKAPIMHRGSIIGTVDFASDSVATEVESDDIRMASAIAQVVSSAVTTLRTRQRLQHQVDVYQLALETSSAAVVYFAANSIDPSISRGAAELLRELHEGPDILHRLLRDVGGATSVVHRSYLIRLRNGVKDVLECTSRPVPGEPGAQLFELQLESSRDRPDATGLDVLSAREYDVAGLVAAGFTDREIADELVLSLHTVRQHVKNIYGKLDISSRVHLTRIYHGMSARSDSSRG